jgi:hypothetical protein
LQRRTRVFSCATRRDGTEFHPIPSLLAACRVTLLRASCHVPAEIRHRRGRETSVNRPWFASRSFDAVRLQLFTVPAMQRNDLLPLCATSVDNKQRREQPLIRRLVASRILLASHQFFISASLIRGRLKRIDSQSTGCISTSGLPHPLKIAECPGRGEAKKLHLVFPLTLGSVCT